MKNYNIMAISFKKLTLILFLFSIILQVQAATIILTSDQQLTDLLDPDKKIDISTGLTKQIGRASWRGRV